MPTTAAPMARIGPASRASPRLDSTKGPPTRMNRKEGRKVNHTTTSPATRA